MALAGSPQWCLVIFPTWLIVRLPGSLLIVTDGNGVSWWRGDVRGGGRPGPRRRGADRYHLPREISAAGAVVQGYVGGLPVRRDRDGGRVTPHRDGLTSLVEIGADRSHRAGTEVGNVGGDRMSRPCRRSG